MKKKIYSEPKVKIHDFIAKNGLMDPFDTEQSTPEQLGKEESMAFDETEEVSAEVQRSVWDD